MFAIAVTSLIPTGCSVTIHTDGRLMMSPVIFAATTVGLVPAAPNAHRPTDGMCNRGSPLFIPNGVSAAVAIPPQLHRLPVTDAFDNVAESSHSSTPNRREFDGFLNVAEPLYIPPESAGIHIPAASATPHPEPTLAAAVRAVPATADPSSPSKNPNAAEHNGVLNVQPPLFVPSAEERQKAEEKAAEKFWTQYWAKEAARLEMVGRSIFPEPLPKPQLDEDEAPMIQKVQPKVQTEHSPHMAALVENMAAFIGI